MDGFCDEEIAKRDTVAKNGSILYNSEDKRIAQIGSITIGSQMFS